MIFLIKLDGGKQKTAGKAGRRVASNLALLLGLWQFMDLVRCHVDLHSVADAIELPIGNDNHVSAETKKATDDLLGFMNAHQ
jgi:hypothetical protein